ncbi:TPA: hypothetical protein ACVTE5_005040 [Salmonella enterica subsp. enterica]
MLLTDYIDSVYGTARGNRARFLKDNPDIPPQELSRWLKAGLKIRPETGEIYKPVSRKVRVPEAAAADAGVFLSDRLRERVTALAIAQNVTSEAGVVSGKPPKFCGLAIRLMTTSVPQSWRPDRVLSLH